MDKFYMLYMVNHEGITMVEVKNDVVDYDSKILIGFDIFNSGKTIYGDNELYPLDEIESYIVTQE